VIHERKDLEERGREVGQVKLVRDDDSGTTTTATTTTTTIAYQVSFYSAAFRIDSAENALMQWNGTNWENLGQVVDPSTPPPSQAISQASTTTTTTKVKEKMVHEGKEYDYVFQIDVSDDSPPIPLPYNLEGASSVSLACFLQP